MKNHVALLSGWIVALAYTSSALGQNIVYIDPVTDATIAAKTIDTSLPVGAIAGSHGVSATGGASYSIPIFSPPGTNGLQPQIALVYNSQGGDGPLGIGWSISGLSAITRTGSDHYHDDVTAPVTYTTMDHFALDGQRLVPTGNPPLPYGDEDAVYDTEQAQFLFVTTPALELSGEPEYFEVRSKDSMRKRYGFSNNGSDPRLINASFGIDAWLLSNVIDPFGNEIHYEYALDAGEVRINQINWCGSVASQTPGINRIDFVYQLRADQNIHHAQGGQHQSNYLLHEIQVIGDNALVRRYRLKYAPGDLGRSYLSEVIEYAWDGTHFNSTIFKYGDGAVPSIEITPLEVAPGQKADLMTGDFDGNGKSDLVVSWWSYYNPPSGGPQRKIYSSFSVYLDGNLASTPYTHYFPVGSLSQLEGNRGSQGYYFSDLNGDGRDDIVATKISYALGLQKYRIDAVEIWQSESEVGAPDFIHSDDIGIPNAPYNYLYPSNPRQAILIGDFTGDGRADLAAFLHDANWNSMHGFLWEHSTWAWTQQSIDVAAANHLGTCESIELINVNGDGKLEVLARQSSGASACQAIGRGSNGQWSALLVQDGPTYYEDVDQDEFEMAVGDFNGDGLGDLLTRQGGAYVYLRYGTGVGWTSHYTLTLDGEYYDDNNSKLLVADFNGDGLSDIFHGRLDPDLPWSGVSVAYSKGFDQSGPQFVWETHPYSNTPTDLTLGDFNADGRVDILNRHLFVAAVDQIRFRPFGKERLMDKVVDGVLNTMNFEYGCTSDESLYSEQDQQHEYPDGDFDMPMTVVHAVLTPDGLGGFLTTSYEYEDGFGLRNGGGFVGFEGRTILSDQSDLKTTTRSEGSVHVAALVPASVTVWDRSTDMQLSHTKYGIGEMELGNPPQMRRYTLQLLDQYDNNDLSGIVTHTSNIYNTVGDNVLSTTTEVGDLQTTVETFGYGGFGPGWPLNVYHNRLTSHEVVTTRTGSAPLTDLTTYLYDQTTGALMKRTEFANTPAPLVYEVMERMDKGSIKWEQLRFSSLQGYGERNTRYKYDSYERAAVVMNKGVTVNGAPAAAVTYYDYDWARGLKSSEVNSEGLKVIYRYDAMDRPVGQSAPHLDGQERYDVMIDMQWAIEEVPGSIYSVVSADPGAAVELSYYDRLGRALETWKEGFTPGSWAKSRTTYDLFGRVVEVTDPALDGEPPHSTTFAFDDLGRPASSTHSLLGTTTTTYEYENGQEKVTVTDPAVHSRVTWTDETGVVVQAKDDGGILKYWNDSHGQIVKVKHGPFTSMTMAYDDHGQRTELWDQSAGLTQYRFDPFGQLVWQKSASDDEKFLYYDELGRLLKTVEPEGDVDYTYFMSGNLISDKPVNVTGFGSSREFTYDPLMRLSLSHLETPQESSLEKVYGYDDFDRLQQIQYAEPFTIGLQIWRSYSAGYLSKVEDPVTGAIYFEGITMDGRGRYTQYVTADGLTRDAEYDGPFPTHYDTDGIQDLKMKWEPTTGNLTYRWDRLKARMETFTYDELDRLSRARLAHVNGSGDLISELSFIKYEYDQGPALTRGNLVHKNDVGKMSYAVAAVAGVVHNDFPVPEDQPPLVISLETQTIKYSSYHQPLWMSEKFGSQVQRLEYTYGPDHQRVYSRQHYVNDEDIRTRLYDGDYERQYDLNTGLTHHIIYVEGGAGLCAMIVRTSTGLALHRYAVYTDHLGSIVALTERVNNVVTVVAEQNFDAWGRPRNPYNWQFGLMPVQPLWLYRGYTGHEHVEPFALINMNGRMYDPVNGRMLSVDNNVSVAGGTQGFNRYSYALNNPLRYNDPSGEWIVAALAIAAVMTSSYMSAHDAGASTGDALMSAVGSGLITAQTMLIGGAISPTMTTAIGGRFGGLAGIGATGAIAGGYSGFAGGLQSGVSLSGAFSSAGVSALSNSIGAMAGSYIAGTGGAFASGALSSTIYGALTGQAPGRIAVNAAISGGLSAAAYRIDLAEGYAAFNEEHGDVLSREQFMGISKVAQASFARGREWGGWLSNEGGIAINERMGGAHESVAPPLQPSEPGTWSRQFHTHPGARRNGGVGAYDPEHSRDDRTWSKLGGYSSLVINRMDMRYYNARWVGDKRYGLDRQLPHIWPSMSRLAGSSDFLGRFYPYVPFLH